MSENISIRSKQSAKKIGQGWGMAEGLRLHTVVVTYLNFVPRINVEWVTTTCTPTPGFP